MSKPGGSYSSSRLDLTGDNVTDLTKEIATNQPVLSWLHSSNALALFNDPYINGALSDPVGVVASIYAMVDPDGLPVGKLYLDALFSEELGHEVTPEDFIMIGAQFFTWLEKKITGFRGLEMVKYLSTSDPAEKLIAGSMIKEAIEAQEKHSNKATEDVDAGGLPKPIQEQLEAMKKDQPQLYALLLEQFKRAAAYREEPEQDTPQVTPYSSPMDGETESDGEEEPETKERGTKLSRWLRERRRSCGIFEALGELMGGREA